MMKYQVGDLVLVKHLHPHPRLQVDPHLHIHPHPFPRPHLKNTFGIITEVEKYSDIFEKDSTENDNGYIWYSQVDGKVYHFYQDEVDGEVIV